MDHNGEITRRSAQQSARGGADLIHGGREAEDQAGAMNTTTPPQREEHNTKHNGGLRIMIKVKNRKLEQFYYAHGVDHVNTYKDLDEGLTVWEYENNEENRRILEEFRTAIRRREAQREQRDKYQRVY